MSASGPLPSGTREELIPLKEPALDISLAQYDSINSGSGVISSTGVMKSTSTSSLKSLTHFVPSRNIAKSINRVSAMAILGISTILALSVLYGLNKGQTFHKKQPIGPYALVSRQEGEDFFQNFIFYEGKDSAGSNGYVTYVSREKAEKDGIVKLVSGQSEYNAATDENSDASALSTTESSEWGDGIPAPEEETYVYIGTAATEEGPRDSIRLEGLQRFNRGLFIMDLKKMPAGCGIWPAFWLTDEHNWPINGEIDIIEGINYQSEAKTAMHTTNQCTMSHETIGHATGWWDTVIGVPNAQTGLPDMTMRYATDCYVYDAHQWLNQGCVAVDLEDGTMGQPLNEKGGGVFALEWDPINKHIRSWAFTPHSKVPSNLRDALLTAGNEPDKRVAPNTQEWGLPYAYFAIGEGTDCAASHFKNMRIVLNTALCGSVAGVRFFMDCPIQHKEFATCDDWVKSNPKEVDDAHWLIRGIYVYEREWI